MGEVNATSSAVALTTAVRSGVLTAASCSRPIWTASSGWIAAP